MSDLDKTRSTEDELVDRARENANFLIPMTPEARKDVIRQYAESIAHDAATTMGDVVEATRVMERAFPALRNTPEDVPENAYAPDPNFQFALSLRRALNDRMVA